MLTEHVEVDDVAWACHDLNISNGCACTSGVAARTECIRQSSKLASEVLAREMDDVSDYGERSGTGRETSILPMSLPAKNYRK